MTGLGAGRSYFQNTGMYEGMGPHDNSHLDEVSIFIGKYHRSRDIIDRQKETPQCGVSFWA